MTTRTVSKVLDAVGLSDIWRHHWGGTVTCVAHASKGQELLQCCPVSAQAQRPVEGPEGMRLASQAFEAS